MSLNKDTLGLAIYNMRNDFFNNQTEEELIAVYGTIEAARLEACKKEAEVIINHIINYGQINATGKGLVAGSNPVTGVSATNIIQ